MLGNTVDASYGWYYPYFVANADVAVLALVTLECAVFLCDGQLLIYRTVGILESACKVCLEVVLVYPRSGFQGLTCVADGITVFDYVLAFLLVFE